MNQSYIGLKLFGYQGQQIEVVSFFEKFNMYQCKEIKNNIVGNPLLSESDIIDLINKQDAIIQSVNYMKELDDQQEQKQLEIERSLSIGEFLINSPRQHAKAKSTLNKEVKYNGIWTTRKTYAEQLASSQKNIETVIYKGKYHYRYIDESSLLEITKTEAYYYNYLKGINNPIKEIEYQAI